MKKLIDIIDTKDKPNILQKMEWGGTRSGSGAKPKYNEPTTTIAFRCPVSKVDELKKVVNTKLAKWAIKK
jgi:hypothetical protein